MASQMTLLSTPFDEAAHRADMRRETIVAALGWEANAGDTRRLAQAYREEAAWFHERGQREAGSRATAQAIEAETRATNYQRQAAKLRASLRRTA